MNPEHQNLTIALAAGWKPLYDDKDNQSTDIWFNPKGGKIWQGHDLGTIRTGVKDYVNDLNAMHEAEETVIKSHEQMEDFADHLCKIVLGYKSTIGSINLNRWAFVRAVRATAAQRAEAFLRTLNKWID